LCVEIFPPPPLSAIPTLCQYGSKFLQWKLMSMQQVKYGVRIATLDQQLYFYSLLFSKPISLSGIYKQNCKHVIFKVLTAWIRRLMFSGIWFRVVWLPDIILRYNCFRLSIWKQQFHPSVISMHQVIRCPKQSILNNIWYLIYANMTSNLTNDMWIT
jgi:hypothetical protein